MQIGYKDVDRPKDALPLGEMLGHSVLRAAQSITPSATCELAVVSETLLLPRVDAAVSTCITYTTTRNRIAWH